MNNGDRDFRFRFLLPLDLILFKYCVIMKKLLMILIENSIAQIIQDEE